MNDATREVIGVALMAAACVSAGYGLVAWIHIHIIEPRRSLAHRLALIDPMRSYDPMGMHGQTADLDACDPNKEREEESKGLERG